MRRMPRRPSVALLAAVVTCGALAAGHRPAAQQAAPSGAEEVSEPVKIDLSVSTSGTDSDFVVKLIDAYPADFPTPAPPQGERPPSNAVKMGGYQQLVRGEPFRGQYRNSFEKPEPLVPGQATEIHYELPDVYHAFRKGHRVMVQVQSSWFPLIDRNPQKFMDVPRAADFQKATERVFHGSSITVLVQGAALKK